MSITKIKPVVCFMVIFLFMILLCSCQTFTGSNNTSKILEGEISKNWPTYLSEDIIPLPGDIYDVIGDGAYLRLFYSGISRDIVIAYADIMEKNGFDCTYYSYTHDESKTNKKSVSKDFDGVHMVMGKYDLLLELTDFGAVYDLFGFPEVKDRDIISWPMEWASLPKPEGVYISDTRLFTYDDDVLWARLPYSSELLGFKEKQSKGKQEIYDSYINVLLLDGFRKATDIEITQYDFYARYDDVYISDFIILSIEGPEFVWIDNLLSFEAKKLQEKVN